MGKPSVTTQLPTGDDERLALVIREWIMGGRGELRMRFVVREEHWPDGSFPKRFVEVTTTTSDSVELDPSELVRHG